MKLISLFISNKIKSLALVWPLDTGNEVLQVQLRK